MCSSQPPPGKLPSESCVSRPDRHSPGPDFQSKYMRASPRLGGLCPAFVEFTRPPLMNGLSQFQQSARLGRDKSSATSCLPSKSPTADRQCRRAGPCNRELRTQSEYREQFTGRVRRVVPAIPIPFDCSSATSDQLNTGRPADTAAATRYHGGAFSTTTNADIGEAWWPAPGWRSAYLRAASTATQRSTTRTLLPAADDTDDQIVGIRRFRTQTAAARHRAADRRPRSTRSVTRLAILQRAAARYRRTVSRPAAHVLRQ